jgi:flagellar biogenesis protein FliO
MRRLWLRVLPLLLSALSPGTAWAQTAAAPSVGIAGARVVGAVSTVAVLLALTLLGLRWLFQRMDRSPGAGRRRGGRGSTSWLSRWMPSAIPAEDRVDVVGRSQVGSKESVCIVRVGNERFLIGITAHRISLLGRLEPVGARGERGEPKAEQPKVDDFAIELSGAVAARPQPTEASVRSMLARSRERLAKLGVNSVHAGGPRA